MDIPVDLDGARDVEAALLGNAVQRSGAVVMGRNLFHVVDDGDGWSDEVGDGAPDVRWRPPFFVVTHNPPAQVRLNLDVTFVTDGIANALDAARAACPPDKDVVILGGGNVIAQAIEQGLVDEMVLRVAPTLMCAGMGASAGSTQFPTELRRWRRARRLSQLDLAIRAGTTQRHVSFIEQGRSRPGRDVVVRLAESMHLTARERNELLAAASFAPAYTVSRLDDVTLHAVRLALNTVLDGSRARTTRP